MSLSAYIRRLIAANNIIAFYKTDDWKELRQKVLEDHHYECQHCLRKGEYTRADCVHHVNEVKQRPDLALSEYYIDGEGKKKRNLIPLCNTCHNIEHEKLLKWQQRNKFTNKERW